MICVWIHLIEHEVSNTKLKANTLYHQLCHYSSIIISFSLGEVCKGPITNSIEICNKALIIQEQYTYSNIILNDIGYFLSKVGFYYLHDKKHKHICTHIYPPPKKVAFIISWFCLSQRPHECLMGTLKRLWCYTK